MYKLNIKRILSSFFSFLARSPTLSFASPHEYVERQEKSRENREDIVEEMSNGG